MIGNNTKSISIENRPNWFVTLPSERASNILMMTIVNLSKINDFDLGFIAVDPIRGFLVDARKLDGNYRPKIKATTTTKIDFNRRNSQSLVDRETQQSERKPTTATALNSTIIGLDWDLFMLFFFRLFRFIDFPFGWESLRSIGCVISTNHWLMPQLSSRRRWLITN